MMDLVVELTRRARSYMRLAERANNGVRRAELLELAACCLDGGAQALRRLKASRNAAGRGAALPHLGSPLR
jgi:hypothetical protein